MQPWTDLKKVIRLDNRGLEPPEPMMHILSALNRLADDEYIVAHNDREPMFLYPKLKKMGLEYQTEVLEDESCRIAIRKPGEAGTR